MAISIRVGSYARTSLSFFFFFQAEDGIRDLTVTGVQTCALPISKRRAGLIGLPHRVSALVARGPQRRTRLAHLTQDILGGLVVEALEAEQVADRKSVV